MMASKEEEVTEISEVEEELAQKLKLQSGVCSSDENTISALIAYSHSHHAQIRLVNLSKNRGKGMRACIST